MGTAVKKGLRRKKYVLGKNGTRVMENRKTSTEERMGPGKSEMLWSFCIQNIKHNGHNIGQK
jgi:hypothetical protein